MRRFNFVCAMAIVLLAGGMACQTPSARRQALLKDRVDSLRPLSTFKPAKCEVEAHLTAPAAARYRAMFPGQLRGDSLSYRWDVRESSCAVSSQEATAVSANYKSFLDSALCLLLQVHWVNSPFDELQVAGLEDDGQGRTHVRSPSDTPGLGLFLWPDRFRIETHTKSRGVLQADYVQVKSGEYLPARIQQLLGGTQVIIDEFEWDLIPTGGRRFPKRFTLSVGSGEAALPHSQVNLFNCKQN